MPLIFFLLYPSFSLYYLLFVFLFFSLTSFSPLLCLLVFCYFFVLYSLVLFLLRLLQQCTAVHQTPHNTVLWWARPGVIWTAWYAGLATGGTSWSERAQLCARRPPMATTPGTRQFLHVKVSSLALGVFYLQRQTCLFPCSSGHCSCTPGFSRQTGTRSRHPSVSDRALFLLLLLRVELNPVWLRASILSGGKETEINPPFFCQFPLLQITLANLPLACSVCCCWASLN